MPIRTRSLLASLVAVACLAAVPSSAAAAASYTSCSGGDPANGITGVRVLRISCSSGLAVAKRTNSVKCFLNGNRCTHTFRERRWTCTLSESSSGGRVHCVAGRRHVRYRLG
jgi:hypothetical protein